MVFDEERRGGDEDPVMAAIRRSVAAVMPDVDPGSVTPGRSLAELGCNSVDRVDVVAMTMDELGVAVPVPAFAEVRDIGTLAELLRRHL